MRRRHRKATMRVAMVIHGYYPLIGGAERQLAAVAPVLQAQGVDVHVITRRFPGLAARETIAGVAVHRLSAPGAKAASSAAFSLAAVWRMARLQPDVIHAHDVYSPTTAALLARRLLGTPVVVKVPRGGSLSSLRRLQRRALGRRRVAWLRRSVDAFISISREIDDELAVIGISPERRVSIPNGVDTTRFVPFSAPERTRCRETLDLPQAPVAVFTGRLAQEKRLGDLLAIWPAVRARHGGALLLLVGAGVESGTLESLSSEGVRFTGPVLDVAPYLQAADLFVLPSAAEGLSNSLLEAMSTGLPCVATAVGGARELIEHGNNGWLVPPGERDHLQQAILTLFDDAELREALGRRARRRVESCYPLSRTATELIALYRRLIGSNARCPSS
ncbi:MAG: glycosyltransferase family 4 protein [Thermoanaerobaculia bacterium]